MSNNAIIELAKEGMAIHSTRAPEYIVCAEVLRLNAVNQDLLEALEEVVRVFESNPPSINDTVWVTGEESETLYDHCRSAIAKAEGESE